MRSLLLLIALILTATAAVLSGFTTAPDLTTVLALGFGGVAVYLAALLVEERP